MTSRTFLLIALFLAILVCAPDARASAITSTLNLDGCTNTCGSAPFGTITLEQTTLTLVTVTETLAANESFAASAGDALEFNVSGPITIGNITAGFAVGPAPDHASTFGFFLESVACTSCQGGTQGNPVGPLSFTVTSASGVKITDFIANSKGYFFTSDIVGNNGNTGNVAGVIAGGGSVQAVPEPLSLSLMGAGLLGLGLFRRRF